MSNEVYANNMEVSCKAAAGKSICAFPDVCFTPPLTPATPPGVPIPYPNTGMASDCTSGSTTVQISGQEVMLKNKSYFQRSSGDEAGSAPKKGMVTSVNMGKVFFNAWSMDVKVEGENVVRNLDLTTHNHASMPGNSPTWPYVDAVAVSNATGACKDEIKKERAACGPLEKKHGTGSLKIGESMQSMCADEHCRKARECLLSPHEPSRCCDGLTPHHVVPAHCFMPPGERKKGGLQRYEGCEGYDPKKAPCICVEGEDKTKVHGEIHKLLDAAEDKHLDADGNAGEWTYSQASTAGINAASEVTQCDKKCLRAQVHAYHKNNAGPAGDGPDLNSNTRLRADSSGNRVLGPEVPTVSTTGTGVGSF